MLTLYIFYFYLFKGGLKRVANSALSTLTLTSLILLLHQICLRNIFWIYSLKKLLKSHLKFYLNLNLYNRIKLELKLIKLLHNVVCILYNVLYYFLLWIFSILITSFLLEFVHIYHFYLILTIVKNWALLPS